MGGFRTIVAPAAIYGSTNIYIPIWVDLELHPVRPKSWQRFYLHSNMGGFRTHRKFDGLNGLSNLHSNMGGFRTSGNHVGIRLSHVFTFQYGWI